MQRAEFERVVRQKLTQVSLSERRSWSDDDFFRWFMRAAGEESRLQQLSSGSPWQEAKNICQGSYGPNAW